jgi:hypothetical protein
MSRRTLVLVADRAAAPPPEPQTDVIVLDTTWTPAADERADLTGARGPIRRVLDEVNLFDGSLELLDAWASRVGLADRFMADDISWWFHARSFLRLDVHELILWCHVLQEIAPAGAYSTIRLPADRTLLVDAAMARSRSIDRPTIVPVGEPARTRHARPGPRPARQSPPSGAVAAARRRVGRVRRALLGWPPARPDRARRATIVDARLDAVAQQPPSVVAIVRPPSFHVIDQADGGRREDPYITPVLERIEARGDPVAMIAILLDHRRDADWDIIEAEERLVPLSIMAQRYGLPDVAPYDPTDTAQRLAGFPDVPATVAGTDLGPTLRSIVSEYGMWWWFANQRHEASIAVELLAELRPRVLYTGWEAARTPWLVAARRVGIPTVAVQHGVIYPNSPDYCRPGHRGLIRPDLTCVFGAYERDILVGQGGYEPSSVVATGSPRADRERARTAGDPEEGARVRRELGVADGHKLLVVSTARNPLGDSIHAVAMAARLLDGPLPGVHIAFKAHPEERRGADYRALLAGLARAGGYRAPPTTVVRDIDVYRLLRAADAHLGLYSTVLTDAVLAGTPNMIAVGQAYADAIGYVEAGVATPVRSVGDVRAFLADPPRPDQEAVDRFLDLHFEPGDGAERIASLIGAIAASPIGPGLSR